MPNTIDVQIVFDATSILAQYGPNTDPNQPVSVSNNTIFMVVAAADALSGNGGGELTVSAQTEDTIRWRETTPGTDLTTILYAFPTPSNFISTPEPLISTIAAPFPNPNDPTQPTIQPVQDYFWNSVVIAAGSVTYHFNFMIVDRSGITQGYYSWDPFITIKA